MLTAPQIAQRAKEQLVELINLEVNTISGIQPEENGWRVALEVVEMKRIPDGNDMLAIYDLLLDAEGNLVRYKRARRYLRGQVGEEE